MVRLEEGGGLAAGECSGREAGRAALASEPDLSTAGLRSGVFTLFHILHIQHTCHIHHISSVLEPSSKHCHTSQRFVPGNSNTISGHAHTQTGLTCDCQGDKRQPAGVPAFLLPASQPPPNEFLAFRVRVAS